MTDLHCDRCGSVLAAPAARTPQGRLLCPACATSTGSPRRGVWLGPALIALSVALFAGWTAYRFVALRADLSVLERRLAARSVGESPPPALTPAQAELLERLAAHPPASASDLAVLRRELSEVEGLLRRPGGLAALAPSTPPPSAPPTPEPPSPPPAADPPPPVPLPPTEGLKDKDPMVRYRALARLERPEEAQEARPLLKDEMGFVRCAAAKVLGRLRAPAAVPDLLAMVRAEGDVLARRAGLEALESITGVPCLSSGPSGEKEALRRVESWRPSGGAP